MKNRISLILTCLGLLFFLLGFLSYYNWFFELFSNFRLYFFFYFLLMIFLSIWNRKKGLIILNVILVLFIFFTIRPYLNFDKRIDSENSLKIVSANILSSNKDYESVISFLQQENPDVIFLMEITPEWVQALKILEEEYPYFHHVARYDNFGIAIYSKFELMDLKPIELLRQRIPYYFAKINMEGKTYNFFGLHPLPPIGNDNFHIRNNQLETVNKSIQIFEGNTIVMGDMNCSSFSSNLKRLTQGTNLKDTRLGKGLQGSWSAKMKLFSFAIDHCFVSENIKVLDRRIGSANGSDHYPIIVELE